MNSGKILGNVAELNSRKLESFILSSRPGIRIRIRFSIHDPLYEFQSHEMETICIAGQLDKRLHIYMMYINKNSKLQNKF